MIIVVTILKSFRNLQIPISQYPQHCNMLFKYCMIFDMNNLYLFFRLNSWSFATRHSNISAYMLFVAFWRRPSYSFLKKDTLMSMHFYNVTMSPEFCTHWSSFSASLMFLLFWNIESEWVLYLLCYLSCHTPALEEVEKSHKS